MGFETYNITGSSGNDTIQTSSGNDIIRGLGGNDTIFAGAGSDIIIIDAFGGRDTISGFEVGIDSVNVSAFTRADVQSALSAYQAGNTTVMALPDNTELVFSGIDIQTLSISDFDFSAVPEITPAVAPPSDFLLEYIARHEVYRAGQLLDFEGPRLNWKDKIYDSAGNWTGYTVEKIFISAENFVAIGLESDTGEPILAVRGTASGYDALIADLDPDGVGFNQFRDAWNDTDNELQNWVTAQSANGLHIVGHSLGGAQAQLVAAFASNAGLPIASLTTYNSAGVPSAIEDFYNPLLVGNVEHRISAGDIVSLAGDFFLEGSVFVYDLDTVSDLNPLSNLTHFIDAHTGHWSTAGQYLSDFDTSAADDSLVPIFRAEITTQQLSRGFYSPVFSNGGFDSEYFEFLMFLNKYIPLIGPAAAYAFTTRFTTEAAREILGQVIESLEATGRLLVTASNYAQAAEAAVQNWAVQSITTIANWTLDTFIGMSRWNAEIWYSVANLAYEGVSEIASWGLEQWDKVATWGVAAWDAVSDWGSAQWGVAKQWGAEAWETLGQWSASQWLEVKDWGANKLNALMNLSADSLDATVRWGSSLLRRIDEASDAVSNALIQSLIGSNTEVYGTTGQDTGAGSLSSETFYLSLGDDTINPGGGFDYVTLGAGSDYIDGSTAELDGLRVSDFTDQDTLQVTGVSFDLSDITYSVGSAVLDIDTDGDGIIDTTIILEGDFRIEGLVITQVNGNTVITTVGSINGIDQDGTTAADTIDGSSGNDIIRGLFGRDTLNGMNGDDTLDGGSGADTLNGGAGSDTASYLDSSNRVTINLLSGEVTSGQATGDTLISLRT